MEYEKIGLFALGLAVFVFLAPKALSFALGSAAGAMVTGTKKDWADRPGRQPGDLERLAAAAAAAAPVASGAEGFSRAAVDAAGGDWEAASDNNAVLARLQARRRDVVAREGGPLRAKVAWKVAVFEQAVLYRVVLLAEGAAQAWNAGNPFASAFCARGLLAAAAGLAASAARLRTLVEAGDLGAIDNFIMDAGFANALEGTGDPSSQASDTHLAGLITAAEPTIRGIRARYDALTALCDPAAIGQSRFFATLDKTGTEARFSASESLDKVILSQILSGVGVLAAVEGLLSGIDALLPRVADLSQP
jgi:hypothetical protein